MLVQTTKEKSIVNNKLSWVVKTHTRCMKKQGGNSNEYICTIKESTRSGATNVR